MPWLPISLQFHCFPLHSSPHNTYHAGLEQPPSQWDFVTYTSFLKRCDNAKALSDGEYIHDQIVRNGLEHYLPLNNLLLQMYGKCDALETVSGLFAQMCHKDLYSWNFVIRAYTRHGQYKAAFALFHRMQEEGLTPNTNIFCSLLSANTGQAGLFEGQQVHVQITGSECQDDVFVSTSLISMYGKCGRVKDAWKMFGQVAELDIISWNTMIAVFNEHGFFADALQLYDRMALEGTLPTNVTYVSILDACVSEEYLDEGKRIHVNIILSEHKEDSIVATAVMNMYGKCGVVENAQKMFDSIHERDRVSWNAVIAAHVQNGKSKHALHYFWRMEQENFLADKVTFSSTLSACADEGSIREGKRVHALLSARGFNFDSMVQNALINMYGKCASLDEACRMLCEISYRDNFSWNFFIAAYNQHGKHNEAFQAFEEMQEEGMIPNDITLISMFEMCSSCQAAQAQGKRLHARFYHSAYELDAAIGNVILGMYGNWGWLKTARRVFDEMPKKDNATFIHFFSACRSQAALRDGQEIHDLVVSIGLESDLALGTAILSMYGKCASLNDAWAMFDRLTNRDAVLWTAMISACTYNGLARDALHLFEEMQLEGFKADKITLVNILNACVGQGALTEGRQMHSHIMVGAYESDVVVGTALLHMYGKCGILEDARRVFDSLVQRDMITWTVIIALYAQHGYAKECLTLFNKMRQAGVTPNEITFINVLKACSHSGLVDEGWQYFRWMKSTHGITPGVDHYNCMIDLLARAGLVEEAEALVNEMPLSPCKVSWTTFLAACREKFDATRGEYAMENVLELDAKSASPYITLMNIYTGNNGTSDILLSCQSST